MIKHWGKYGIFCFSWGIIDKIWQFWGEFLWPASGSTECEPEHISSHHYHILSHRHLSATEFIAALEMSTSAMRPKNMI